ncbi:MAG: hypothetical protein CMP07_09495 [Xanthomonadales bacterium]|nr:hypothetical protein [Xanthomonadales bacterium]
MRILLWVALAALVVAIVVGSLMSSGPMTRFPPGISPGMTHLLAYSVLGVLAGSLVGPSLRGLILAFVLTAAVGMGVEILQLAIPARTFSFYDLGMNVIGAGIGVAGAAGLRCCAAVLGLR